MCSFILLISNKPTNQTDLEAANKWIQSRGPDQTHIDKSQQGSLHIAAIHNLLDISGCAVRQPLHDKVGQMLLFNGEIYAPSDGKTPDTLTLYHRLVNRDLKVFLRDANGEYAIATLDLNENALDLYTDLIGTKPLAYGWKTGMLGVASYPQALISLGFTNAKEVEPNRHLRINIDQLTQIKIHEEPLHHLGLEQSSPSLTGWSSAFLESVALRAGHFNSKVFVPLSAGYDSGAICCALNQLQIPYVSATVGDSENLNIIRKRVKINKRASCTEHIWLPPLSDKESLETSTWLESRLGTVRYSHLDGNRDEPIALHEDAGAIGLAVLCREMVQRGFNTLLSGSGADEIISDYGHGGKKIFEHSQFGGLFPDRLEGFFPWRKFYGDTQRSYLKKDEMVAGLFGIEGRYPFLDRQLIQAFLKLSPELKNQRYKHCIASLLDADNYPYEANVKTGFYALQTQFSLLQRLKRKARRIFRIAC